MIMIDLSAIGCAGRGLAFKIALDEARASRLGKAPASGVL
jgi:hypothetical protein